MILIITRLLIYRCKPIPVRDIVYGVCMYIHIGSTCLRGVYVHTYRVYGYIGYVCKYIYSLRGVYDIGHGFEYIKCQYEILKFITRNSS